MFSEFLFRKFSQPKHYARMPLLNITEAERHDGTPTLIKSHPHFSGFIATGPACGGTTRRAPAGLLQLRHT